MAPSQDGINDDLVLDIYFRQSWTDSRLQFPEAGLGSVGSLHLDWRVVDRIWVPDTVFTNTRVARLHTISVPNRPEKTRAKILEMFTNAIHSDSSVFHRRVV